MAMRFFIVGIIEIIMTLLIILKNKNSILKKYIILTSIYGTLLISSVFLRLTFVEMALKSWGWIGYVLMYINSIFLSIAVDIMPTIIAYNKKHIDRLGIFLLDILLGWTVLGWIGAMIWACILNNKDKNISNNKYEDLEKLMKLKSSGVISEEEFEIEKTKVLRQ